MLWVWVSALVLQMVLGCGLRLGCGWAWGLRWELWWVGLSDLLEPLGQQLAYFQRN